VSLSEAHYLTAADGVRLHIRIKGTVEDRPPILYLHGGPGGGMNLAAFETCAGPHLEPCFPVAYLHQRGVLNSRSSEKINQSLPLHIEDIHTAVAFLRRRFQSPRIYLLGHSWGGFTACAYLIRNDSTVAGFVAICPVVSFPHVQQDLYELVSKNVGTSFDPAAHMELSSIGEPLYPDIDDFIRLQGLAVEAQGDPYRFISARDLSKNTGYSLDRDQCLADQTRIAASLWPELYTLDLTASLELLATPLLMIACERDAAVPLTSVEKAFSAYGRFNPGAVKQWLLLENSNHLPFTEPANRQPCMDGILDFLNGLRK
jgi:pimeloyl-ACP methyl ester carboxylesterase